MKHSRLFHESSTCAVAIPTAGMDGKSLGVDRFELGSLSGDSQEHFSDLSHAGKTSDLRSQLNSDDFKLGEWRSGVLWSREMCLLDTGVEESHVGLVTGCQGRIGNGQLNMQGVVLQTWCRKNSTHPSRRQIAITRRAGKDLAPDVGTKAGILEDTMWPNPHTLRWRVMAAPLFLVVWGSSPPERRRETKGSIPEQETVELLSHANGGVGGSGVSHYIKK